MSGLSQDEIARIRQENLQQNESVAPTTQDLSFALELSRREEEARLNRLRDEEEELEKVLTVINIKVTLISIVVLSNKLMDDRILKT